jgi:RimJ/RimL family protein N-acetyltransferase
MSEIVFRDVEKGDFEEIKDLHIECFPIQYDDIFFQNVCNGKGYKNRPLYTKVAIEFETCRIVGCILAQFVQSKRCEDQGLFSEMSEPAREVFYILTLGLRKEYRRSGVGTLLLCNSLDFAKSNRACGAVYLHVIHYNKAAINFYERNAFRFVREAYKFYNIDKSHHSAYLYILYINGFQAPVLTRLFRRAKTMTESSFSILYAWVITIIPRLRGSITSIDSLTIKSSDTSTERRQVIELEGG